MQIKELKFSRVGGTENELLMYKLLHETMPGAMLSVKIEFNSADELRDFINKGETLFKVRGDQLKRWRISDIMGDQLFKIVGIKKKSRHSSMEAIVQKITLREYNLERLL